VPGRFPEIAQNTPIEGEGFEAMKKAREISQPVVLVSGHFGNYDVVRARLIKEGFDVGALYRPPNNPFFAAFYHRTISRVGTPIFRRGRRGLAQMVKFLRGGGTIALLMDQHVRNGAPLTFFGLPAKTALSAADMALKYNALLVPCYGIRQADGLSFKIALEAPIPIGTPEEMTQALNDSLEARVRENMDQWLWIHRRWKDHD
jgi:KDO2-lipid IV(A) lauroyltransferase